MSYESKIGSPMSDNQWKLQETLSHYVHQVWIATRLSMTNVSSPFSKSGKNLTGQHRKSNFMALCVVGSTRRKWRILNRFHRFSDHHRFSPHCCKSIVVWKSNVLHCHSSCKTLTYDSWTSLHDLLNHNLFLSFYWWTSIVFHKKMFLDSSLICNSNWLHCN